MKTLWLSIPVIALSILAACQGPGNIPVYPAPEFTIITPTTTADINAETQLNIKLTNPVTPAVDCCSVIWTSDVDGTVPSFNGLFETQLFTFKTLGTRTLSVKVARLPAGLAGPTTSKSVTINVINTPPTLEILKPLGTDPIYKDIPFSLQANTRDPNELGGRLDCSKLTWTSSVPGDGGFPKIGCNPSVTFNTVGPHTLTLNAKDTLNAVATPVSVTVNVLPAPTNKPPVMTIIKPITTDRPGAAQPNITVQGSGTDPEGGVVTLAWYAEFKQVPSNTFGAEKRLTPDASGNLNLITALGLECTISGYDGEARVTLKGTDPQGNVGQSSVILVGIQCFL
jgi:hypothetical protein